MVQRAVNPIAEILIARGRGAPVGDAIEKAFNALRDAIAEEYARPVTQRELTMTALLAKVRLASPKLPLDILPPLCECFGWALRGVERCHGCDTPEAQQALASLTWDDAIRFGAREMHLYIAKGAN